MVDVLWETFRGELELYETKVSGLAAMEEAVRDQEELLVALKAELQDLQGLLDERIIETEADEAGGVRDE